MDHFLQIYNSSAKQYHQLIEAEDVDNHIFETLTEITSFHGKHVLDLGSGTGRIPLLLQTQGAKIIALDLHLAMLKEHATQRNQVNGKWDLLQGDMHQLPFSNRGADVILAGWALGHFVGWFPQDWEKRIAQALNEMQRVVSFRGTLIIMETLGTGSQIPAPPHDGLAKYYALLENKWNFSRQEISTDYSFTDINEAVKKLEFFFGKELSEKIRTNHWSQVPEWTGIWVKRIDEPVS